MLSAFGRPAALGAVRAVTVALLLVGTVAHLGWVLGFFLDTGLSPARATTGELSAGGQPYRNTFRALEAVAGAAFVLSGPPLLRIAPVTWQARLPSFVLVTFGGMLLLRAGFTLDCAESAVACGGSDGHSTAHRIHQAVTVLLSFLYVVGAAGMFAFWQGRWRYVAGVALLVQVVAWLAVVGLGSFGLDRYAGLANRAQLLTLTLVLVTGIYYLLTVGREDPWALRRPG